MAYLTGGWTLDGSFESDIDKLLVFLLFSSLGLLLRVLTISVYFVPVCPTLCPILSSGVKDSNSDDLVYLMDQPFLCS